MFDLTVCMLSLVHNASYAVEPAASCLITRSVLSVPRSCSQFRMQNGTMIRLQNTILHRSRAGPASLAVGMDFFAPTLPGA